MRAKQQLRGFHPASRRGSVLLFGGAVLALTFLLTSVARVTARQESAGASSTNEAALLAGVRHVEVASVSDALEQLTGKKMYMTHRMRPIFSTRFVGRALTVQLKKE